MIRPSGQGYELTVQAPGTVDDAVAAFHAAHEVRYGYVVPNAVVEIVNVRVVGTRATDRRTGGPVDEIGERQELLTGPVTVPLEDSTVRIEAGWTASRHATGAFLIHRNNGQRNIIITS